MPDFMAILRRLGALMFSKSLVLAWVLLAGLLGLTYGESHIIGQEDRVHTAQFLKMQGEEMSRALENRFKQQEALLHTSFGLILASENVTEQEWEAYRINMNISEVYPGLMAFGYAQIDGNVPRIVHLTAVPKRGHKLVRDDFLKALADGSRITTAHLNKGVVAVPEYAWLETAGIAADEMPTLLLLAKEFKGKKGLIFA